MAYAQHRKSIDESREKQPITYVLSEGPLRSCERAQQICTALHLCSSLFYLFFFFFEKGRCFGCLSVWHPARPFECGGFRHLLIDGRLDPFITLITLILQSSSSFCLLALTPLLPTACSHHYHHLSLIRPVSATTSRQKEAGISSPSLEQSAVQFQPAKFATASTASLSLAIA